MRPAAPCPWKPHNTVRHGEPCFKEISEKFCDSLAVGAPGSHLAWRLRTASWRSSGEGSSRAPGVVGRKSWWPSPLRGDGLRKLEVLVGVCRKTVRESRRQQRRQAGADGGMKGLDFMSRSQDDVGQG